MEPFVLLAVRPIPSLGIRAGDHVVWDPAMDSRPSICRPIPNTGAVLLAYEEGALEPLTPCPLPADLALAVGYGPRSPALSEEQTAKASRASSTARQLRLLK